jgi:predicted nuclease with TOPRIM domain
MKEQIQERIEQLKAEYESGQKMLADLETQESNLRTTMLRISGAIQVLKKLLAKAEEEEILDDAKKVEVLSQCSS